VIPAEGLDSLLLGDEPPHGLPRFGASVEEVPVAQGRDERPIQVHIIACLAELSDLFHDLWNIIESLLQYEREPSLNDNVNQAPHDEDGLAVQVLGVEQGFGVAVFSTVSPYIPAQVIVSPLRKVALQPVR